MDFYGGGRVYVEGYSQRGNFHGRRELSIRCGISQDYSIKNK